MASKISNHSAERNRMPILDVLKKIYGGETAEKHVLEISSGSGQHVTHFAKHFPSWSWQPSDCDDKYLSSIQIYTEEENLTNVAKPLFIDVTTACGTWGSRNDLDLVLNINMIHITPIACAEGLFTAAGTLLKPGGRLITYGPYAVDGMLTPESNVHFDAKLKSQNASWGVRDVRMLEKFGIQNGIMLDKMFSMPANNKCLVFLKS